MIIKIMIILAKKTIINNENKIIRITAKVK